MLGVILFCICCMTTDALKNWEKHWIKLRVPIALYTWTSLWPCSCWNTNNRLSEFDSERIIKRSITGSKRKYVNVIIHKLITCKFAPNFKLKNSSVLYYNRFLSIFIKTEGKPIWYVGYTAFKNVIFGSYDESKIPSL